MALLIMSPSMKLDELFDRGEFTSGNDALVKNRMIITEDSNIMAVHVLT